MLFFEDWTEDIDLTARVLESAGFDIQWDVTVRARHLVRCANPIRLRPRYQDQCASVHQVGVRKECRVAARAPVRDDVVIEISRIISGAYPRPLNPRRKALSSRINKRPR